MSLSIQIEGSWDFCFDPLDSGSLEHWNSKPPQKTKKIELPHVWQAVSQKKSEQIGFYFKQFEVPDSQTQKRCFLRFESIHPYATVWLNGVELGSHLGGYSPFFLNASQAILPGQINSLAVRVAGPNSQGMLEDRHASELPLGTVGKYAPYCGITGDVQCILAGRAGIRYVGCFPDYEADRVTIETKFWNPKNFKAELEYTLRSPDGNSGTLPKTVKLEKENGGHAITFDLQKAKTWSPEHPTLYELEVGLAGSYSVRKRFGLRRVEIERCCFKINHSIIKVRGVGFLQVFPFLGPLPPYDYDLRGDLERVKDAGFNLVRAGGTPLSSQALDICDELGLYVIQETACFDQKSHKESLEDLKAQIKSIIERDVSHPCVIAWAIGAENGSMVLENGNKLLRFASDIDPYRPIFSNLNSVYLDSQGGGKIDLGKVFDPVATKIEPFESHKLKISHPVAASSQKLLTNYCTSKDGKAVNDGIHGGKSFWERYNYLKAELGGKILVDGLGSGLPGHLESMLNSSVFKKYSQSWETAKLRELRTQIKVKLKKIPLWPDPQDFFTEASRICEEGTERIAESLLINRQISGYLFDTWADYGLRFHGILDHLRQPKPQLEWVKRINQKTKIMSEAEIRTPYMGTSAAIKIYLLNETGLKDYQLLVRVKGLNNRIWHQESMPGRANAGLNSIGRFKFPVGFEQGSFTFDLTLSQGKKELAKKEEVFFVPPKVELEAVLKSVRFAGKFPNAVTYASDPDSGIIVIRKTRDIEEREWKAIVQSVREGAVLIIGSAIPEDLPRIGEIRGIPRNLALFRSSWTNVGCFHYALKSRLFNSLPNECMLGQVYADVKPAWSFERLSGWDPPAGCIAFTGRTHDAADVRLGADVMHLDCGRGSVWLYQFDILSKLGKNSLADLLFSNLVEAARSGG